MNIGFGGGDAQTGTRRREGGHWLLSVTTFCGRLSCRRFPGVLLCTGFAKVKQQWEAERNSDAQHSKDGSPPETHVSTLGERKNENHQRRHQNVYREK